ncbi:MAG TPA: hypothetical protein VKU40_05340, partial [Thermoanaerobaculia bacterium]|nr:hypothetical protein [Thermoanaerobaculia bacterium]
SRAWTLFSIVLVTLAVPLGIWLFDHPLIVLLPLSAAGVRSKNLDKDPAERREPSGRQASPRGHGSGADGRSASTQLAATRVGSVTRRVAR